MALISVRVELSSPSETRDPNCLLGLRDRIKGEPAWKGAPRGDPEAAQVSPPVPWPSPE